MSRNFKIAAYVSICVLAVAALALFVSAPAAAGGVLLALTIPPAYAARNSGEQQTHYFRYRMQFANLAALAAGVKIGRLPSRAFVNSVHLASGSAAFNAGTTNTVQLGTTQSGVDILAATALPAANVAAAVTFPFAGSGLTVTGSSEVDVWLKYAQTGGAATAGDATVIVSFTPDNDQ